MDMTNFGRLKGAQSGSQAQKYNFWVSFVNHTGSVEKTWNLANFILIIVTLDCSMYWLFHWYKNKQKLVRDGTRKTELWKIFFLYLNKRTVVLTVSCGSTLPVFAFGSAKIASSFLRDLAFEQDIWKPQTLSLFFQLPNFQVSKSIV